MKEKDFWKQYETLFSLCEGTPAAEEDGKLSPRQKKIRSWAARLRKEGPTIRCRKVIRFLQEQWDLIPRPVHWASAEPGGCPRKDSGQDKRTTTYPTSAGPGTITDMAEAIHYGNVTCARCRRLHNRANSRKSARGLAQSKTLRE